MTHEEHDARHSLVVVADVDVAADAVVLSCLVGGKNHPYQSLDKMQRQRQMFAYVLKKDPSCYVGASS
jgi:hypothetical protein